MNAETCKLHKLFHDRGPYHIETSSLICRAGTSAMKVLKVFPRKTLEVLQYQPFLRKRNSPWCSTKRLKKLVKFKGNCLQ